MKELIEKAIKDSIALKESFFKEHSEKIIQLSTLIAEAFNDGKKLLLFGNGGSATDASHIAAEFVNRFKRERPGLPAIALNTDMAVITSIANDYDYSEVFVRQLRSLATDGDIVIAISTSGSSKNVLKAMDAARKKGLTIVAFTGAKGKKMASKAHYSFMVPSTDTPRIQEIHIMLGHIICELVEEILFELPRR
ncbi:MAG: D-sedoheptulose 7-phosphate isomerase [Nitrospirae bacterium]|nr:D-sedoheptulose 7-phosphate isomerase [Nitrospirota bacterium]